MKLRDKLTPLPEEVDSPEVIAKELVRLRNIALSQADFDASVLFSHAIAYLNWIGSNLKPENEA